MTFKHHLPEWKASNGVYGFVAQASARDNAEQANTDTALQTHPKLGQVLAIKLHTIKGGRGQRGHEVTLFIPLHKMADTLSEALPKPSLDLPDDDDSGSFEFNFPENE